MLQIPQGGYESRGIQIGGIFLEITDYGVLPNISQDTSERQHMYLAR